MTQKFKNRFVLIPIGLFWTSGTLLISQFRNIPDGIKGILFGIGIGLMLLPFILKKIKTTSY